MRMAKQHEFRFRSAARCVVHAYVVARLFDGNDIVAFNVNDALLRRY